MKICNSVTNTRTINRFKTLESDFISIHGNTYDYSDSIFFGTQKNMEIVCEIHGVFSQKPSNHLAGKGCQKCGAIHSNKDRSVKAGEDFVSKANDIHSSLYDYSRTCYLGSKDKVEIICKIHGSFSQSPSSHLQGRGCPVCSEIDRIRLKTSNELFRVYYISISNVWKIGVTSNIVERLMYEEPNNIVCLSSETSLETAILIEKRIIKKFKRWKSNVKVMRRGNGDSELFCINILKDPSRTIERMIKSYK